MEFLKKHWPLLLCIVIILVLSKCNYDGAGAINVLKDAEKASKEREAIYREQNKELQLQNNKHLNKISDLENEVSALKGEIKNIQKDEKEKLDKVDTYTPGELQRFFTDRYGK